MLRLSLTAAVALAAAPSFAEPTPVTPKVRLQIVEASECLREQALRDAVAARLGYQPFDEAAPARVLVQLEGKPEEIAARVERFDERERSLGERRFAAATCADLAPAVELALAIAIDPMVLTRPVLAPPVPPPPPSRPPAPSGPPVGIAAEAGGAASFGLASAVAGGIAVGAELRWPSFSLGLEGQGDFPSASDVAGSVQVGALFASVVPCFRLPHFGACGLVLAGATQVNGGTANIRQPAPLVAVGARALGEVGLWGPLSARLQGDLVAPVARTTVLSGADVAWSTPLLAGDLQLMLSVRLR